MTDDLTFTFDVSSLDGPVTDDSDIPRLTVEMLDNLQPWNRTTVTAVDEAKTKKGADYLWITYVAHDNSFKIRQAYFRPGDIQSLLFCLGIKTLTKRSQIVGKTIWLRFGTSTYDDRTYVRVSGYSKEERTETGSPGGAVQGGDMPLDGSDSIPF